MRRAFWANGIQFRKDYHASLLSEPVSTSGWRQVHALNIVMKMECLSDSLKHILARTTQRAVPVIRNILEQGAGGDAAVRVPHSRIVNILADRTSPFLHSFPPFDSMPGDRTAGLQIFIAPFIRRISY
jgi:hypothetical protein